MLSVGAIQDLGKVPYFRRDVAGLEVGHAETQYTFISTRCRYKYWSWRPASSASEALWQGLYDKHNLYSLNKTTLSPVATSCTKIRREMARIRKAGLADILVTKICACKMIAIRIWNVNHYGH